MSWDPFDSRPEVLGGRFRIREVLGEGGAGAVYVATDEQDGRDVAVKLVEAPALQRPVRFLAEARDMARLHHPRIVPVLSVGHEGHWYWLVMELMPGGSLKQVVVRSGPLAPARAVALTFEVLQGLDVVHRSGLVHRDIKPHNILLDADGHARLTDFGLARHLHGDVPFVTGTEESLGSPSYRAPEQARDPTSTGPEADLYSAAAVLFFVLTGKRPHFFYMMTDEELAAEMAGVPDAVRAVIVRAMSRKPEDRYRSAREMADVLADVHATLPGAGAPLRFEIEGRSGFWERVRDWFRG